jgi:ADP-heptose:LPS heptosyltransferase
LILLVLGRVRGLVIRLSALGDVVLAEPVARAFRAAHPEASVDLLTDRRYVDLMQRASFDRVIGLDRHGEHAGLSGLRAAAASLRDPSYDRVIDLQGKVRTRVLARAIGASEVSTMAKRSAAAAVASLFGHDPPIVDRHSVDLYLDAASLPLADKAPRLERRRSPEPGWIGLSVGATHATKRWPSERFAELADRLSDRLPGSSFVLIGGPADRAAIDDVAASVRRASVRERTTDLGIAELVDRIERLSILVSVDTGPAHVAAALGVPVVVLFGPTSPIRWGPIGAGHRVARIELECAPCSNIGGERCPLPSSPHTCMRDLSAGEVERQVLSALGASE